MNPGFSSTKGVHISMTRFSEVTYDSNSQTAVVGAGLIWDNVYAALEPHNVSIGGARATGIGVGGFALGGGMSEWLNASIQTRLPSFKVTHGMQINTV